MTTTPPRALVSDLVLRLAEDPNARSKLADFKPELRQDLAEAATAGKAMCASCAGRLRAAITQLMPFQVEAIFGQRMQLVDPQPLTVPKTIRVGTPDKMQEVLEKAVYDDGIFIRNIVPMEFGGELYVVLL